MVGLDLKLSAISFQRSALSDQLSAISFSSKLKAVS